MRIILRGKDQLEELANNFLFLARRGSPHRSQVMLTDVLDDIIASVRFGVDCSDTVAIENAVAEEDSVYGNETEIRQVFSNIISNAFQSMPDGGIMTIRTETVEGNEGKPYLKVTISDTGCGIEEENLNSVREPFYTTKERGTGLGLAIVSNVVEAYGGELIITSEIEKGTTCIVTLPREQW
jgi:two-component system sensor histidine kinase PilS (NtrC family)